MNKKFTPITSDFMEQAEQQKLIVKLRDIR